MMNAKQLAARTNVVTMFVSKSWAGDERTALRFLPRERQVIATTQNRIGHTIASTILPTTEKTWSELYESCVTCGSFNRWEMSY
jgi:hypothetical protein